jgi:ABC-2 type transport system permease protein
MGRVLTMLGRELRLGPRSPVVLLAVAMPILMTVVVAAVFGNLLVSEPRLGIYDAGQSEVTAVAAAVAGIRVTEYTSESDARDAVAAHNVDAVLLLPPDLDEALQSGSFAEVTYLVSGQSLASDRAVLAASLTAVFREVAGEESAVQVTVVLVGDEDYIPIGDRVLPLLVVYALVVAALFVPAASILDEREKGTLNAVLATPVSIGQFLLAKAIFAGVLALAMGVMTLLINSAFGDQAAVIVLSLAIGTVMLVELGLILGLWAKDMNTLYTWIKAGGILIVLPGLLALFPSLPSWIAHLAPTYYFLQPIYEASLNGAGLSEVWPELAVALAICLVLLPVVLWSAKRTEEYRLKG